ncbi:MAG: hypothetical protein JW817_08435, partial [Clostridiales bacterium]|nr:hypothetical protein [Clostridiales bacterium]
MKHLHLKSIFSAVLILSLIIGSAACKESVEPSWTPPTGATKVTDSETDSETVPAQDGKLGENSFEEDADLVGW